MRRGAPLSEHRKNPVISPHPADISTVEEGSYDKNQKSNGFQARPHSFGLNDTYYSNYGNITADMKQHASSKSMYGSSLVSSSLNRYVFFLLTKLSTQVLQSSTLLLFALVFIAVFVLPLTMKMFFVIYAAIAFGIIGSLYLSKSVLECDDGTEEMRQVSDPIREGAEGFLSVQYSAIAKFALPLSILLVISYQFRPSTKLNGAMEVGNTSLGVISAVGFLFGAICSAISGYSAMWVAAQSNIRVASAARRTYTEALVICFRGGAFSALLNLTLCVAGVATFFGLLHQYFCVMGDLRASDLPILMVGYGFGASFVALFMQLGGGIYTKAADVGADLVGKVENSVPEDDPRNPATIADLVGDMVGDCVGSSADLFESVAAEMIGAMILGSTLANEANFEEGQTIRFLFFPLVSSSKGNLDSRYCQAFSRFLLITQTTNRPIFIL